MGMTIDDCIDELQKLKLPISKHDLSFHFVEHTRNKTIETAIDTMRKYQMMQADYENRLKADLIATLTEIQLEIEEMDSGCGWEGYRPTAQVIGLIQQKINTLKEQNKDPVTQTISDSLVAFSKQVVEDYEKEQNNE